MYGARRFLAHESRSKYTVFLRKWQGYFKKNAYFWLIIFFFVYLHPFFQREESFVSIYNKVRAWEMGKYGMVFT